MKRERIPVWIKNIVEIEKGEKCGICGEPIKFNDPSEIDHIYPLSKGGSDSLENLHMVHKLCNRRKGGRKIMVSSDQWKLWWELIRPNLDKLRDNQIEAYMNTVERYTDFEKYPEPDRICYGGRPKIYCECTGGGKSILMLILGFFLARKRILIVTPSTVIKKNNFDALKDAYDIGIIPKKVYDEINITTLDRPNSVTYIRSADIVISTYQKLGKSDADRVLANLREDDFDIVLIDEGHHYKEGEEFDKTTHREIVRKFKNSIILFFTATPFDAKLNPILEEFDKERDVIHEFKYADAWLKGYVKYFEWTEIKPEQQTLLITHPNGRTEKIKLLSDGIDEAKKLNGYKAAISKSMATKISLIHATIQLLDQRNEELRGRTKKNIALIVFPNIEDAEECSKILDKMGLHYKHCIIHSKLHDYQTVLKDIKNDVYDILLSINVLKEGFDQKNITIVTLCRNIQSYVFFNQVIGRGVRARKDIHGKPIPVSGHARDMKDICYIVTHEGFGLQTYWDNFRELDLENLVDKQEEKEIENRKERVGVGSSGDTITMSPELRIEEEIVKGYDSDGFDDGRTPRDETMAYYFREAVKQGDDPNFKEMIEGLYERDEGIGLSKFFQKSRSLEFAGRRNTPTAIIQPKEDHDKKDLQAETAEKAKRLQYILTRHITRRLNSRNIDFGTIMKVMYATFLELYGHPLKSGASKGGYSFKPTDVEFINSKGLELIEKYASNRYFEENFWSAFKKKLDEKRNIY